MNTSKSFKVFSLSALSTSFKIITNIIISKLIAVFLGPQGLTILGYLKNIIAVITGLSTAGIDNGIIQNVSFNKSVEKKDDTLFSALYIIFISSLILSILVFFTSDYISNEVLNNHEFSIYIKLLAVSIPFISTNLIFVNYLNGLGKYSKVVKINITGSILNLLISSALIYYLKLYGAILSLVVLPIALFLISLIYSFKSLPKVSINKIMHSKQKEKLLSFSIMTITSAILVPSTNFAVRYIITNSLGLTKAGFWDAINLISNNYFQVFAMTISLYMLPEISKLITKNEVFEKLKKFIITTLPLFIIGISIIYYARVFIVDLFLSENFMSITNIIQYQFIGDIIKFCSWMFGIVLIARKKIKYFIISEFASSISMITLSYILINFYGLNGVLFAYIISFLVYFSLTLYLFWFKIFK